MVYKLLPCRSTCCAALYRHRCLLTLLRALWGDSSMRNKDIVRRGSKVQCMWPRLVCFAFWWCSVCTLAIATALGVFVCLRRHRAAASVLEHDLIFTVLARFCLYYSLESCRAIETVPSWHGCTCQCKRSISFVYINILRTMCNWRQHSLIWRLSIPDFYVLFFVYTNSHLVALLPSLSKPTASKLYIVVSQHSPKTVDQQCC